MNDLPFIPFPKPKTIDRPAKTSRPGATISRPGRGAQSRRLGPYFDRLGPRLETPEGLAELRNDPGSIAPDRAIVFELAGGNPEGAYRALRNIGFELLGEDEEIAAPEHGFAVLKKRKDKLAPTDKRVKHRLYFAMPSVEALKALVSLWKRYDRDEPFNRRDTPNLTAWLELFEYLSDIRPWGPQDRLPPETVADWQEDLREFPEQPIKIEIELWYRQAAAARRAASAELRRRVTAARGRVLDEREIDSILYHAVLAELPAAELRRLIADPADGLSAVDEVMFLRPQTLSRVDLAPLEAMGPYAAPALAEAPQEHAIVALFDGLPLAGHVALANRLRLDDPDNLAAQYAKVEDQQHGTAMAAIILNGDARTQTPIPHRLYVRPVLVPGVMDERFPAGRLAVYLMYEALQRMLVGSVGPDGQVVVPPAAPAVKVINISLGDAKRRFAGVLSPWARLLDHFAFVHRLLILVSAGNINDPIKVPGLTKFSELEDMNSDERTAKMVEAMFAAKAHRTLLSPAEGINVLTVGARHADDLGSAGNAASSVDPYHLSDIPNVSSALGTGAIRSAKPEILMNGGRELVRVKSTVDGLLVAPVEEPGRFFGIGTATPGVRGELDRMKNASGTSPATALATHEALRIERSLRAMPDIAVPDDMLAVVLKALLAHGAAWHVDVAALIGQHVKDKAWQHVRLEKSRFLGLGVPTIARVLGCSNQRALVLGFGEIECDKADPHELPLPKDLSGKNEWRGLTATLAWLTPIHVRHGSYRHAALDLEHAGLAEAASSGVAAEKEQPDDGLAARGTIVHRRWSGIDPTVFIDNQGIQLNVSCRSPTKGLDQKIPYALAVTMEVGVTSTIDIYADLNVRVRAGQPIVIRAAGQPPPE